MQSLYATPTPGIFACSEFLEGHFVTWKNLHRFSEMAHNQIHEQLNAVVKGNNGVIGITEYESALRCWMITNLEMATIISEISVKHPLKLKCSHH